MIDGDPPERSDKMFMQSLMRVHLLSCVTIYIVNGFAFDLVLPHHRPKSCDCDAWVNGENQSAIAALWGNPNNIVAAGSSCAMVNAASD